MQLIEVRRVSRRRRTLRYTLVAALAAVVAAGWLAYDPALAHYRAWKRQRALTQARQFIAQHDIANTQLALDIALHAGPADPDTIRVAADMLEQAGAPQAMRLRRAVTRMAPDSAADAAALVLCCLRFQDYNSAKDALHAMPAEVARQPVALKAALAYAMATNDAPIADFLLQQLRAQTPNDDALAFTHAALRLKLPRATEREAAARELEALATRKPQLRSAVEREFAGAAFQRQDYAEAEIHLQKVLASPEATLADRLQEANIALLVGHEAFAEVFARLAPLASRTPADAAAFIQWLLVQDRIDEAYQWTEALAPAVQHEQIVRRLAADIAARRHDWDRLQPLLKEGVWGPVPAETLRFIAAAVTVDGPGHGNVRQEVWDMAVAGSSANLPSLNILLRLAKLWRWDPEYERTEWAIVRASPDQSWAYQDLFNYYRQKQNTNGMRNVLAQMRENDSAVPRYQHDWALLSLLTEPTQKWDAPKSVLEQLYQNDPRDATYATAYAFALAQADRSKEAVAVIGKLSTDERAFPPRQPYLAYIFGVARLQPELEAAESLAGTANYLPEEKQLLVRAREALTRVELHSALEAESPTGTAPKT